MQSINVTKDSPDRRRGMMGSQLEIKYINNVKSMSNSTAQQYKYTLDDFANFVNKTYECNLDSLIHKILNNGNHKKETT